MRVGSVFKADDVQTLNGGDLETLNGGGHDLEGRTFLAGDIADANPDFRTNLIEEDSTEEQQDNEMSD